MKIAIIGTGISGLVCAHLLHRDHDLTLFEANDYVGGHTHTVDAEQKGRRYAVDTGFIVFNDRTYPNFIRLLGRLDVESQPSSMSFSVRCETTGLEYNGTSLNTLFAQRRNLFRPSFHRMIGDILRFNREATEWLDSADDSDSTSLLNYLNANGYSREFIDHYIVPMGAAIWSADPDLFSTFPAGFFISFFKNHGMLSVKDRPQWRVIKGGSRGYVDKLIAPFRDLIRLRTPVAVVRRFDHHALVTSVSGEPEKFDVVILAVHANQALRMLADASPREREILGAIPYQSNHTVLHTDSRLLPRSRRAWASWNYHLPLQHRGRATVTYNMNRLQTLKAPKPFCVSLNRTEDIDRNRVLGRFLYDHPVFTPEGVAAQRRWEEINGGRTFFCGAYWGYGFHEDGVKSALRVCERFGRRL